MSDRRRKLTDEQVAQIRQELATGANQGLLAARYGVSRPYIGRIGRGLAHKLLPQLTCPYCKKAIR